MWFSAFFVADSPQTPFAFHAEEFGGITMANPMLYISHDSALHFWRTNPSIYYLEGADQNIRGLRGCPSGADDLKDFNLPEIDFGPDPIDVLVPPGATRIGGRLRCHVQKAKLPPRSLYPLYGGIHVVSPELCLVQACKNHPFLEALIIGMEFCGTYALRPHEIEGAAPRDYSLVDAAAFSRHVMSWQNLDGIKAARRISPFLVNGSASPMETMLYLLLCLPPRYGGYNLKAPEFNPELDVPLDLQMSFKWSKVKPDLLWRDESIVVEYDGAYHDDERQASRDMTREILLKAMGYTVHRVKKHQVYNPEVFDAFAQMLAKALGKRIRPLTLKQSYARDALRAYLPKESVRGGAL